MNKIRDFFESLNLPEYSYKRNIEGFERNPDIAEEFSEWLETHQYRVDDGALKIRGYTASKIAEMAPFLDGAGAFNFLITLREKPEKAEKYIQDGFKRK